MCFDVIPQALEWIHDTGEFYLSTHTSTGSSIHHTQELLKEHEDFQITAKVRVVCVWLFVHLIICFELKEGKMLKGHLCCSLGGASVRVFVQSCAVVWGPFPGWCIVLFSHCCVTVIVSKHKLLSIIKHWFPTPSLSPSCSPLLSFTVMSTSLPLWLLLFPFFYPFF